MSVPFKSLKTKLGLDDILTFGKYKGCTVLELIQERNGYIDYLILKGIKFYPSVHQELKLQPFKKYSYKEHNYPSKRTYFYDGQLRGDMAHNIATQQDEYNTELLGDWFDDVPF